MLSVSRIMKRVHGYLLTNENKEDVLGDTRLFSTFPSLEFVVNICAHEIDVKGLSSMMIENMEECASINIDIEGRVEYEYSEDYEGYSLTFILKDVDGTELTYWIVLKEDNFEKYLLMIYNKLRFYNSCLDDLDFELYSNKEIILVESMNVDMVNAYHYLDGSVKYIHYDLPYNIIV